MLYLLLMQAMPSLWVALYLPLVVAYILPWPRKDFLSLRGDSMYGPPPVMLCLWMGC